MNDYVYRVLEKNYESIVDVIDDFKFLDWIKKAEIIKDCLKYNVSMSKDDVIDLMCEKMAKGGYHKILEETLKNMTLDMKRMNLCIIQCGCIKITIDEPETYVPMYMMLGKVYKTISDVTRAFEDLPLDKRGKVLSACIRLNTEYGSQMSDGEMFDWFFDCVFKAELPEMFKELVIETTDNIKKSDEKREKQNDDFDIFMVELR